MTTDTLQDFAEPEAEAVVQTINADATQAYERGKEDINFFAALMLPRVMRYALPPFYIAIFKILTSRSPDQIGKILRFCLGLPRGHAKTTFIKIVIAWLIVYDKVTFVLIICATGDLAEYILKDISDMLGSRNAEAIYGKWTIQLSTDNKVEKVAFYHNRIVTLVSKGADQAVRGINIDNRRPDLIFCDDMQTRENDESVADRKKLRRWMTATLFKTIETFGDRLIIYVGNMYSEECILYKLQHSPSWISIITGAILEDGQPLWPELHSIESLMESYLHDASLGEADVWFAEVMNDPRSIATSLITSELPACPHDLSLTVPDGVFLTIDPAGFRDHADDNVIVVHYVIDGKGVSVDAECGIKDPEQLIIAALRLAHLHGASAIGVEDVGYQQTLLFWFNKYFTEHNIKGIDVVPLKPHNRTKETRIRQFIQEIINTNWYIGPALRAAFIWQALKYKLGAKKNKDDLLDATAYAQDMRNEYWHLIKNLHTAQAEAVVAEVVDNNTPF